MLDAYVIEEIKRRERDQPREDRPAIELPVPTAPQDRPDERPDGGAPGSDRGIVIIDYAG